MRHAAITHTYVPRRQDLACMLHTTAERTQSLFFVPTRQLPEDENPAAFARLSCLTESEIAGIILKRIKFDVGQEMKARNRMLFMSGCVRLEVALVRNLLSSWKSGSDYHVSFGSSPTVFLSSYPRGLIDQSS